MRYRTMMQAFQAQFSDADDLLREAAYGRLRAHGPLLIESSGRIGPVIELIAGAMQFPYEYDSVSFSGVFARKVHEAWATGQPFGGGFTDNAGAFPLPMENPVEVGNPVWEQWVLHAENAAKNKGFPVGLVASLAGAMGELQDNVYQHSGAAHTGLVAYAVTDKSFEFVVADRGMGVLETLRQNPDYAYLSDAGAALTEAIRPGVSRFPASSGRGLGFIQLCKSMVTDRVELRFRSGDHALTLCPTHDPLNGHQRLTHCSALAGLTISAIWRAEGASSGV